MLDRRNFLKAAGAFAVLQQAGLRAQNPNREPAQQSTLKAAAQHSGRLVGLFVSPHELLNTPPYAALVAREFSMVADVNDLKFSDRLRPTPDTFNFEPGDQTVEWARQNKIYFRGHCLVWWNALPKWLPSYMNAGNARQVLTSHISTVARHYAGQVYSWDVVNEPTYHDTPDGLRLRPWVQFLGPEYIDLAFHTAAEADPKARLILNECYIEHDTPAEIERRGHLLALLNRLRKAHVPITGLGIQSHLRGNVPVDSAGMLTFVKQVQDLGLDIMITEMDVDDLGLPAGNMDALIAEKYRSYIGLVGPYASSISFQWLQDIPSQRRPDGTMHRPNMFDASYAPAPAYAAVAEALATLPRFNGGKRAGR